VAAQSSKYQTITGRRLALSRLTKAEKRFLAQLEEQFRTRPEWTRFAAWWNAALDQAGLGTDSPLYAVCQDLEARLGIEQGKVSPPDYRDFLADLLAERFGTRQEFCQATGVDPGQLSRVFAGRADLSMGALHKVLEVLGARLVILTEQDARERASVTQAEQALQRLGGKPRRGARRGGSRGTPGSPAATR
jgi:hypothetical protein